MIKNIILIGSGSVATHIARKLIESSYKISIVFSRRKESAKNLAEELGSAWTNKINKIKTGDLIIIALKDAVIKNIIRKLPNIPVVHTAGAIDLEIFEDRFENYGVLYPIQTLNKNIKAPSKIPFCIEANNKKFEKKLKKIANSLSDSVYILNSKQRKSLHVAAVFAANFSNHMYSISHEILKRNNIDFNILLPLIEETYKKIIFTNPTEAQTGPAKRKDLETIESHINLLDDKTIKTIYKTISKHIMQNE